MEHSQNLQSWQKRLTFDQIGSRRPKEQLPYQKFQRFGVKFGKYRLKSLKLPICQKKLSQMAESQSFTDMYRYDFSKTTV